MEDFEQLQTTIQLNTVYKIKRRTPSYPSISPSLLAEGGGTVNVYIRDTEPTTVNEMKEVMDKYNIQTKPFCIVHPYLYVEQNKATVNKVVLIGIQVEQITL